MYYLIPVFIVIAIAIFLVSSPGKGLTGEYVIKFFVGRSKPKKTKFVISDLDFNDGTHDVHVDHIIIGGQEPEQKPARSIFDKALQLANCAAHEAIHVGDSLATDIAGAQNSGITSVWIQHQQPLDAELGINPEHKLLHPSEIPQLIRDLHQLEQDA